MPPLVSQEEFDNQAERLTDLRGYGWADAVRELELGGYRVVTPTEVFGGHIALDHTVFPLSADEARAADHAQYALDNNLTGQPEFTEPEWEARRRGLAHVRAVLRSNRG